MSLLFQRLPTMLFGRWDCILASWAFPDAVAIMPFAKARGIPVVIKVHGSDVNVFAGERMRGRQIRWALSGARRVITVSRALAHLVARMGIDTRRLSVLYNGVDKSLFQPRGDAVDRAELGWKSSDKVILYVGNLKLEKGCVDLVDAFIALTRACADCKLLFIGDGVKRSAIEDVAKTSGVADSVRCVGRVDHAQLAPWFRMANVLCLPSHAEGVPNVILEAMCCGLPVVATNVGGIPEVLPTHCGLMVEPHRPAALASALRQALTSSWDHAAIAAQAEQFDWQANARQLLALLHSATDRGSSAESTA